MKFIQAVSFEQLTPRWASFDGRSVVRPLLPCCAVCCVLKLLKRDLSHCAAGFVDRTFPCGFVCDHIAHGCQHVGQMLPEGSEHCSQGRTIEGSIINPLFWEFISDIVS